MGEARVVMATDSDLKLVLDILAEAAIWLREERGIRNQWSPSFREDVFAQAIRDGEMFLI